MKQKYFVILMFLIGTILCANKTIAQGVFFTASAKSGCRPLPVTFTSNLSSSSGDSWNWNFGDGSPNSSLAIPTHTYKKGGYYWVNLNVNDANNNFLGSFQMSISISGAPDSLQISQNSICPGDQINPYINMSNSITSVTWNFGDGYVTNNSYNSMQHIYNTVNTYTISAIVKSSCGLDTMHGIVHVQNNALFTNTPYFSVQSDSICPNDQAVFWVDWSYQNYAMDFGDGTTITHTPSANGNNNTQILHNYVTPGNYVAKVTYFNSCGNSKSITDTIHVVNNHLINGSFSIDVNYGQHYDTACVNSYVQFYPNASAFQSYKWNFGGGVADTSSQQTPTHRFTTLGKHIVKLIVTNGCGNSKTITDTVKIVNNLPFGGLATSVTPTTICPGSSILYNAYAKNSNGNGGGGGSNDPSISFAWRFGDNTKSTNDQGSHTLPPALGTYSVTCVGTNACGSKDSSTILVTVSPNAMPVAGQNGDYRYMTTASGRPACPNDSIIFIFAPAGNGTVHWDFGDATNANATQLLNFQNTVYTTVKHAYTGQGHYVATVTYTNSCGNNFSDTMSLNINPHVSDFGTGNGNMILYDNTVYPCQGTPIPFYALEGSSYVWNFGDGTGDLVTHLSLTPVYHAFADPGKYRVTLRAFNACGNSATDTVTVNIPASKINITTNSVNAHCHKTNGKAIAVVNGGTAPYSYQWSNGKLKYINDSIPAGIYVVTITDKNGCSNFKIATVNDAEAPTITVNTVVNVSCFGGNDGAVSIQLIGSSSPYAYHWSTGATSQDINNQVAGPKEITVTDANGCVASKSINIGESPPVYVSVVVQPATCGNADGAAIAAVSGTTGPYNYIWSNNTNVAANSGIAPGSYTVTVVDNNGCLFNASATVSNMGGPFIYTDSITGTGCGSSLSKIYIHAAAGTAPYTYSWSNGASTQNLTNGGVGSYLLAVTGHNGCQTFDNFNITHDAPAGNPICLVSVDTATNTNQVIWNKEVVSSIDHYTIYKESSQNGLYYQVDTVSYHSLSQWTDPVSDPQVRSWKYKIGVVDNCGDESVSSVEHKTIHLNVNQGLAGAYNLIWDEYTGFAYSTFLIDRFTIAGGWVNIATVPSNVLSYTDVSPPANTYSYRISAVPNFSCTPTRAAINTTHSNIKRTALLLTGVENDLLAEEFNMFPNPTNGILNLSFPASQNGYHLNIYDELGQVVYTRAISKEESTLNTNSKTVDLTGYPAGMYIVTLDNAKTRTYRKLILR
jgi:PKD repeat protein